jgi:single-strand DNA-binding protein
MDEMTVTLVGRLAGDVNPWRFADGTVKASFRLAASERRYDTKTREWRTGRSLFITVQCWRGLAEHALLTLKTGDPVMVHGQMFARDYEKDGRRNTVIEVEASAVGPDLMWCTAALTRTSSSQAAAAEAEQLSEPPIDGAYEEEPVEAEVRAGEVAVGVR